MRVVAGILITAALIVGGAPTPVAHAVDEKCYMIRGGQRICCPEGSNLVKVRNSYRCVVPYRNS